jgi:ABC-type amino acid transport substrate-binding protein
MRILIKISISLIYIIFSINSLIIHPKVNAEIPSDIKKIITRGKIIVAINSIDYPPFFYSTNSKKFEGFDVEIAEDIAKNLGVTVEYNRSASIPKDVVKLVENEQADIAISAISATLSWGLTVRFSDPYLIPNQCLIVNRILEVKLSNHTKIDPALLKIAILHGDSYNDFAKQKNEYFKNAYNNPSIIDYDSLTQALSDTIEGKILGLYTDEFHADYIMKHKNLANIYVRKKIFTDSTDPISIALNWKSPNLANWINLYIKRMNNNEKEKYLTLKYLRDKK